MANVPVGGSSSPSSPTNPIGTWPGYNNPTSPVPIGGIPLPGGTARPGAHMPTSSVVAGTSTSWHMVVLWFLGAMALLALASPAPNVATMIVVLLIVGTLLTNWPTYKSYLGL
jgi:hypothetical protein